MLTITRSLPFSECFSVLDSEGGPYTDLSASDLRCQIRESVAVNQQYPYVVDVPVTITDYGFRLDLSEEDTQTIPWGNYLLDVVDTMGRILMPKQPVKVVGHVTLPNDPEEVPDFVAIFLAALNN